MRGSPSTIMCVGGGTWLRSHWDQQCPGDASGASRQVPAEVPVRRVLLLNVTYEPLTTVGLRRAVCLVLCEKAEIVHHDSGGQLLHSSSISLAAPFCAPTPPPQGAAGAGRAGAQGTLQVRGLRAPRRDDRPRYPAQPGRP